MNARLLNIANDPRVTNFMRNNHMEIILGIRGLFDLLIMERMEHIDIEILFHRDEIFNRF